MMMMDAIYPRLLIVILFIPPPSPRVFQRSYRLHILHQCFFVLDP